MMIDMGEFQQGITAVRDKLRHRLGARGRTLAAQMRRAGRALPRSARQAGTRLTRMERMAAHPRLRRLIDRDDARSALATLNAPLDEIDPAERRKDRVLGLMGSIVANLLLLAVLLVALLRWRGLI